MKEPLSKENEEENLLNLSKQLAKVKKLKSRVEAKEKVLSDQIRDIASRYSLPIVEDQSQYLHLPYDNLQLRVTEIVTTPAIDATMLLEQIKDPEVFLSVVNVLKVELREIEWRRALDEERVTNTMLLNSLKEPEPRKLVVAISKRPKDERE